MSSMPDKAYIDDILGRGGTAVVYKASKVLPTKLDKYSKMVALITE